MKALRIVLFIVLAFAVRLTARAELIIYTNDVLAPSYRDLYACEGRPYYYRIQAVQGSIPLTLYDRKASLVIRDASTEAVVLSTNGTILSEDSAEVVFTFTIPHPGSYTLSGTVVRVDNSSILQTIAWDSLSVTSPPTATGGGGTGVTVNIYNVTTGTAGIVSNVVEGSSNDWDSSTGQLTINTSPPPSSVGGITSLNGDTNAAQIINAAYPLKITYLGNGNHALSLDAGSGGTIIIPSGGSSTSIYTYVSTNAQLYVAPPTATGIFVFGVGAAAGTSPGGLGFGSHSVTGLQVLSVYGAQGGVAVSNGVAKGGWGWGIGGYGTSTGGQFTCSGAGAAALLDGTNEWLVLGGAGGSVYNTAGSRSPGGGEVGGWVGLTTSGYPGTQTNAGAGASANTNAMAGVGRNGGNGTEKGSGASTGCGGGAGKFGGGGGSPGSGFAGGGGAGSSFVAMLTGGYTDRNPNDGGISPPGTSSPYYFAPYGVGATGVTNNQRANHSLIVIVSYP